MTGCSATCWPGSTPTPSSSASGGGALLPPKRLGWRLLDKILDRPATPLCVQAAALRQTEPRAVDVSVHLGGDRWLRGTVPEVYGDRVVAVTYSRLAAKHRLASWVQLLALAASDEDRSWTAHTIGRPRGGSREETATSLLGPLDHTAADVLRDLVALRDRGLCEPVAPAAQGFPRPTPGLAVPMPTCAEALRKAGYDWSDGRFPGEQSEPAALRAWGHVDRLPGSAERPDRVRSSRVRPAGSGPWRCGCGARCSTAEQGSW